MTTRRSEVKSEKLRKAVIDTGPLVAIFAKDDSHHGWVTEQVKMLAPPLLVCEPVLTETIFLLQRAPAAQDALFTLLERGSLSIRFELAQNAAEIQSLMRKYRDRPTSLADTCVIRMAELNPDHWIFTLDSDFKIYRKHGRQSLNLICPE